MNEFLAMLEEVELNSQADYLTKLKSSGESVGGFIPAWSPEMLVEGIENINQIYKLGINLTFVSIIDEVVDMVQGLELDIPIISISQISSLAEKPECIIMLHSKDTWPDALYQYFLRLGLKPFILWDSDVLKKNKDLYWSSIQNLYNVYNHLEDELSKKSFLGVLKAKFTGQPCDRIYAPEVQYMVKGFMPTENFIAIDGGAFDGETARMFSELGAQVYSFELDKNNFYSVEAMAKKYNYHAVNMGLWSCRKQESYFQGGEASTVTSTGNVVAELIDIDTFVSENSLPRVDYIKLDVEGAELEVLKGAVNSISKWKPILAVSAYHRDEDLWTLFDYIKSIRPDYQFSFRHHRIDARNYYLNDTTRNLFIHYRMDLMIPTPWESVLYAR